MEQKGRFRHELKYSIGYPQYLELRSRVRAVMKTDPHTGEDGRYLIRSIYFDNFADKALREKVDGASKREKFRIRYYNDDFSFITLEKKIKDNALCMKCDARITEEECRMLLAGDLDWMRGHASPLVQELYSKMHYQLLRPECWCPMCGSLISMPPGTCGSLSTPASGPACTTGRSWRSRWRM